MRMKVLLLFAALVTIAGAFASAAAVRADTMSFAIGIESNFGTIDHAYEWRSTSGAVGLRMGSTVPRHYYMPMYWTWPSAAGVNRTITLRYRVPTSADELDCSVFIYDDQGNVVSKSAAAIAAVTGSTYGTRNMVVNHVPAGANGVVACTLKGEARALSISWTP